MLSPVISSDIQANVLKPHNRNVCCFIFCRWTLGLHFNVYRSWIQEIGEFVTNYQQQKDAAVAYKAALAKGQRLPETSVNNLALTFAAYPLMNSTSIPKDFEFKKGMHNRRYLPDYYGIKTKDETGNFMQEEHHALICLANDSEKAVKKLKTALFELDISKQVIADYKIEWIHQRRKKPTLQYHKGELKGPFDFKDNISKPPPESEVSDNYRFAFLHQRMQEEPDPHGTYLAAQKIICHLSTFEQYARQLQAATGYSLSHTKALLLGRFQNGTPLDLYASAQKNTTAKAANNFDYQTNQGRTTPDPQGGRCPLHAHIRSVNPRKNRQLLTPIVRRGLSYHDQHSCKQILMFLSFQASIKNNLRPLYDNMLRGRFNDGHLDALVYQPQQDFIHRKATNTYVIDNGKETIEIKHPRSQQRLTTFTGSSFYFLPSISFLRNPR